MLSESVQQKIREIEIYTRRVIGGFLAGNIKSRQKGFGFDFDQIREYQQGDDVRFIDWKATSKMNNLLLKQYTQERQRTIFLAIDISASTFFSSSKELKADVIAQIGAVIAFIGYYMNDTVSLVLFSDKIESFIPPSKGKSHVQSIAKELYLMEPGHKKTDISCAINCITSLKKKDSVIFIISDFIMQNPLSMMKVFARRHEVIAIRCLDYNEKEFPSIGFLNIEDMETGATSLIGGNAKIDFYLKQRIAQQDLFFKSHNIEWIDMSPGKEFMDPFIRFFKKRVKRA